MKVFRGVFLRKIYLAGIQDHDIPKYQYLPFAIRKDLGHRS